ncbi:MAG TPA: glycine betaine ABC transporter substrate-binding protein [Polyangia bacterium]|nr:glycine betaine ABC transporter substrate-binding protein [Polyangia bacterium]
MTTIIIGLLATSCARPARVVIGSKKFTESVLLGELLRLELGRAGVAAEHRRELGGSRVLFEALLRGDIDVYPEYSGTLRTELVPGARSDDEVAARLAERGLLVGGLVGFSDTYALAMSRARATALGVTKISDLAAHPELRYGFSDEFMRRKDGWPTLQARYGLGGRNARGMDHDLAYRGLAAGALDVVDLYSTDAEAHDDQLLVLVDDRHQFPDYRALWLSRADLLQRVPAARDALTALTGRVDEAAMATMNARAKRDHVPETQIAAQYLAVDNGAPRDTLVRRLLARTREHLTLAMLSLLAAIAVALPLGILAARRPRLGGYILALVGIVQTIPSLALLVVMIPLLGIGVLPALAALFLYGLLPIVRNTYVGLRDLPPGLLESADALGLSSWQRLRLVELPMASRAILGGVKTAAVINVGAATLGALVGAGGYGQPILSGIRLASTPLILEGAIPAALLALAVEGAFDLAEYVLVPRGLRLD